MSIAQTEADKKIVGGWGSWKTHFENSTGKRLARSLLVRLCLIGDILRATSSAAGPQAYRYVGVRNQMTESIP